MWKSSGKHKALNNNHELLQYWAHLCGHCCTQLVEVLFGWAEVLIFAARRSCCYGFSVYTIGWLDDVRVSAKVGSRVLWMTWEGNRRRIRKKINFQIYIQLQFRELFLFTIFGILFYDEILRFVLVLVGKIISESLYLWKW